MHIRTLITLAVLGASACTGLSPAEVDAFEATDDIKGRDFEIVGGSDTSIESAPWQVSLRRFGSHFCGGAILSPTWIVTAAHCVEDGVNGVRVAAGTSFRSQRGTERSIVGGAIAPGYVEPSAGKDFALLELDSPLPLDGVRARAIRFITPVQSASGFDAPGVVARVTGWGTLRSGGRSPDRLQSVNVPILPLSDAERAYGRLTSDQLPAGLREGGRDSCQGDSGGPLVVSGPDGDAWLAGVVSWGVGCGSPGRPGMYARVSSFESFIRSTTGITTAPVTPPATSPSDEEPPSLPGDGLTALARGEIDIFGPFALNPGDSLDAFVSGTGDPDLYMAFGREPSPRDFDCRSWTQGAREQCRLEASARQDVYVAVFAYRDATYALDTEIMEATAAVAEPVRASVEGNLRAGQRAAFQPLRAAAGSVFEVEMQGSGDADLFVRVGAAPTATDFDCRPFLNGSNERCRLEVPSSSEIFLAVEGARASNYRLDVTFTPAP